MLEITTKELPTGYIGEEYYVQLKTNCSKSYQLIWIIESGGALPPNLVFGKDGVISGIPEKKERADYNFVVTNQDTKESIGKVFQLVVISRKPTELKIITDSITDVKVGAAYSFQFEGSGGVPPYIWSADDLPAGLNINENGIISGTAKFSGGKSPLNVKLCDSKNNTASRFYYINVGC